MKRYLFSLYFFSILFLFAIISYRPAHTQIVSAKIYKSVEIIKSIMANLPDQSNFFYLSDQYLLENESKIRDKFDLSSLDLIAVYYDTGRVRSGTRGILLTENKIVWKHVLPSPSFIFFEQIKARNVNYDALSDRHNI